jgi:uncharacterized RDD family membrane protein YckC
MTTAIPVPAPIPEEAARNLRKRFQDLAPGALALRGRRAGIVSRGVAWCVDVAVVLLGYPILVWIWGAIIALVHFTTPTYPDLSDWAEIVLPLTWNWAYFTWSWILTGRTVGMTMMGLKVVARKGVHVGIVRANIRYVVTMATILWIGPLWLACSKSRLAIHDRVAHTQVIYDGAKRQGLAVSTVDDSLVPASTD